MKNFFNLSSIAVALIVSLILTSCAQSDQVVSNNLIQKRKYNKGYFISANKNKKEKAAIVSNEALADADEKNTSKQPSSTSEQKSSNETTANNTTVTASANEEVEVINEVSTTTQKSAKSAAVVEAKVHASKRVQKIIKKAEKAQEKENLKESANSSAAAPAAGGGHSQLIALIICFFVGALGIHRFYLGYTWQGIVQLLTLGACGIWSLIDFIRIITGDLQPKSGRYSKTL